MTKLDELVSCITQPKVYIQTHNFPDPDAIASAYGLQYLLKNREIEAVICYKGKIDRMSLRHMLEFLDIKISNIDELNELKDDDEIILVDAQKGNANIIDITGDEIACIDHHPTYENIKYRFADIRNHVGACASIVASYYFENNIEMPQNIATVLLYGIKIDTANMTRGVAQLDLDMFYRLYNMSNQEIIRKLESCNLQFDDLNAYANAIRTIQVFENVSFANTGYDCPEQLVASISDFMLALSVVEFSVVYSIKPDGIKISVRSSRQDMDAGMITQKALKGIGSGGGHPSMAGGFVPFGEFKGKTRLLIDKIRERYINVITEDVTHKG